MSDRTKRLRRVQFAVPASSEKLVNKGAQSNADHVFLDLEDAVAPNAKDQARALVIEGLNSLDWGRTTRCVRINDLANPNCYQDIVEIVGRAGKNLDTIMVPKVKTAADIHFVATLLDQVERKVGLGKRIGIEVLIEDVEAIENVFAIARSNDRIESLIFGVGDFSASMGIDIQATHPAWTTTDILYFPRFQMVMAAHAFGIDAIDGPTLDIRNTDAYRADAERGRIMGFTGKWAIHPAQVEPAMQVFTPDPKKVALSRRLLAAYEEAENKGIGSITFEGLMVDAAVARNHRLLVAQADAIGT